MKDCYSIAVCDDEKLALDVVSSAVKSLMSKYSLTGGVETFFSARDFLERTKTKTFDLIFLDVEMPELSGIKLGKILCASLDAVKIIFVSGREDKVFDTFEVSPFAFVRKSKLLTDLESAFLRFVKGENEKASDNKIILKKRSGIAAIDVNLIEYVESNRNFQNVFMSDGSIVETSSSMSEMEKSLSVNGFLRVHRGYIVSLRFIKSLSFSSVTMKNGAEIPVSRGLMQTIKLKFMEFLQENNIFIN